MSNLLDAVMRLSCAELCKCRWKNLKDVFVKEKRKLEQHVNGTSVKHKRKWKFYDKLTFLCGYMPVKEVEQNSSVISEDLVKEMQQSKEMIVIPHLQEEETESLEISQNRDIFHGIKRKCACISLKGPDKLHLISEVKDEEGHFGETVAAVLRRLTPYQRAVAKVKIQELLLHAEFDEKDVIPSNP
ncbi:uncharacterized protein LOC106460674 isoform X2 [Limulus polyphemus]|uniref:Uncharacterized protein LOC106460674 isoform X2 n=1 Tax=Limulus polyphemus TaxID=6850 RepID=A0ABM1B6M4_LIMPO|nr:uncharacterized protein LOC106460674 isoform X2 [Limulus polyphemus]